jgi:hypothetical protein
VEQEKHKSRGIFQLKLLAHCALLRLHLVLH